MKALIVDGEELFRLSLREVVIISGNFSEVIEVTSERDFLAKTAEHANISLVVLHPESLRSEGSDWVKLVRRLYPEAAIVSIMSANQLPDENLGSTIQIARNVSVDQLVSTLRKALHLPTTGDKNLAAPKGPDLRTHVRDETLGAGDPKHDHNDASELRRLSYRQKQILAMAAGGLPNKEIAARLSIAEGTVKAHMHAIFKVLSVTNRTQAVLFYTNAHASFSPEQLLPSDASAARVSA